MENIIDAVFGEMTYNHGWVNRKKIQFWGEVIDFKIKVVTYEENIVLESQREDYQYFMHNLDRLSNETLIEVEKYIEDNKDEIYPYLPNNIKYDVKELVKPKTILFDEENVFGILCDCLWDEHGIGIQILPNIEVGTQDILL
jgi:hypothetical protein